MLQSKARLTFVSDSNRRFESDLAALYGISPGWPWIWAGAGMYYMDFERQIPDYWSPANYLSYGPRITSSFPIARRFTGWTTINLSVVSEDEIFSEIGDYVSLGVNVELNKGMHLRLGLEHLDSVRDGAHYFDNKVFLSFHRPVF